LEVANATTSDPATPSPTHIIRQKRRISQVPIDSSGVKWYYTSIPKQPNSLQEDTPAI